MPVSQLATARVVSRHASEARAPIRVVLADNHPTMRRSLRLLLDGERDMQVVAEAGDLAAVMREVHQHRPRVLVLDLGMTNGSSVEAVGCLRREVPGSEIVVLSMEENPAFEWRAIHAGAIGFVVKDRADHELPDAIRSAAHGQEHVRPSVSLRQRAIVGS